jgi:hypothetical protein
VLFTAGRKPRLIRFFSARLAAIGLAALVVLAILLRLQPILVEPSAVWPDEIFQTSEPAHRLVFGSGLVAWEFQLGVRSWLLPGIIAGLMELSWIARRLGRRRRDNAAADGDRGLWRLPLLWPWLGGSWRRRRCGTAQPFALTVSGHTAVWPPRPFSRTGRHRAESPSGLGDDWRAYGGYTYFHWRAPM